MGSTTLWNVILRGLAGVAGGVHSGWWAQGTVLPGWGPGVASAKLGCASLGNALRGFIPSRIQNLTVWSIEENLGQVGTRSKLLLFLLTPRWLDKTIWHSDALWCKHYRYIVVVRPANDYVAFEYFMAKTLIFWTWTTGCKCMCCTCYGPILTPAFGWLHA